MRDNEIIEEDCLDCKGIRQIENISLSIKATFVCSACKGAGTTKKFMCGYHSEEQVEGLTAMCWICIAEDDDYRKSRRS